MRTTGDESGQCIQVCSSVEDTVQKPLVQLQFAEEPKPTIIVGYDNVVVPMNRLVCPPRCLNALGRREFL